MQGEKTCDVRDYKTQSQIKQSTLKFQRYCLKTMIGTKEHLEILDVHTIIEILQKLDGRSSETWLLFLINHVAKRHLSVI